MNTAVSVRGGGSVVVVAVVDVVASVDVVAPVTVDVVAAAVDAVAGIVVTVDGTASPRVVVPLSEPVRAADESAAAHPAAITTANTHNSDVLWRHTMTTLRP
ncbi:MAG: hypothetical protein ACO20G_09060 [Ilumatobacteraceae bacterium]